MSRYEVTHACGHAQDHSIVGTNVRNEREREAARLARLDCSACYGSRREAERLDDARAHADLNNLPPLQGSERQVEWAERIRVTGIAAIVNDVNHPPIGYNKAVRAVMTAHTAVLSGPALDQINERDRVRVIDLLIGAALRQTGAGWWIDNRAHITGSAIDVMSEDEHAEVAQLLGHP